jgi:anthranilate synthase component 1
MNQVQPDLAGVRRLLAEADVVPVVAQLPIGDLTPVDAMAALGVDANCFLLESVEGNRQVARWSLLGHKPSRVLQFEPATIDPLQALARDVASLRVAAVDGLSLPFTGGAVGYLSYEAARRYERLPIAGDDPLRIPDAWFAVFPTVVVFDHAEQNLLVVSNVIADDERGIDAAYAAAVSEVSSIQRRLAGAKPSASATDRTAALDVDIDMLAANMSKDTFERAVQRCLDYIVAGDIFQVQISRRFSVALEAHPFAVYRALRRINPSPYMFYLATPDCTLVGASPEMLVRVTGEHVLYHPIAGTRRRGRSTEDDQRMEDELRRSEKEQAEHLMLVDLGRNDVGRVCATGSVQVTQMMEVERYSHVMHLVSSIEGRLGDGCTSLDALRACFPAGTVTGAPKIRAMEIIAELETEVRGPYAGVAGYVSFGGDLDTAIALRTIVVRDGTAYVQAAAGIVADSNAREEALEIDNKVRAPLLAIAEANAWSAP